MIKIASQIGVKVPPNTTNQQIRTNVWEQSDSTQLKPVSPHKCATIEDYRSRIPPHIPDGHFKKYSTYSHKRMSLQTDAENIARVILRQKAEARESLRPKLPGAFSSLYESDHKDRANLQMTLSEKIESRPPLCADLSVPSPTTYTPKNKPPYEKNAPIYTFGTKEADKTGGGRQAWGRPYMRSTTPYTYKGDYERKWPTPFNYVQPPAMSRKQVPSHRRTYPSHTFGRKPTNDLWTTAGRGVPAANYYYAEEAALHVRKTAPGYTMSPILHRKAPMNVPPPDSYSVSALPRTRAPAYSFLLSKRFVKRHETGPFMST